jgi:hypothetical protein
MLAALHRLRIAVALALVLAFALPAKAFAEVSSRPSLSTAGILGLEVGRAIEIVLPHGLRIQGIVREISATAAVIEYRSASGETVREELPLSAVQTVQLPPKVDNWLDKHKWWFIVGLGVAVTALLVYVAGTAQ